LVLYEILIPTNIVITIVFWVFLLPDIDFSALDGANKLDVIWTHCVPLICTQIEFWFNAWRFKYTHGIIVILFGLIYGVVNMIATLA